MKFTLSWLKEYLNTTKTVSEIEEGLVSLGLEVEEVIDPSQRLKDFVVALVVECHKHPDADRLSLCEIDDGSGCNLQVVCGAKNIRKGLKIAFARVGCIIPSTGEPLKKGKIRGVESHGMVCSLEELGFKEESEGIVELDTDLPPGSPLQMAFNFDPIFDVSITPNRSDCFSIRGIARDLSALGFGEFIDHPSTLFFNNLKSIPINIDNINDCPYFSVFEIQNVKNTESPQWIKQRLEAIGQKSISALVDITNYIMIDTGQPLHVFDADKIALPFHLKKSDRNASTKLLDEQTYTLTENDLVVSDANTVHALAGIKGGYESRTEFETNRIYLEAATYNPISIALSGQHHAIFSDGRARHERGIDRQNLKNALLKALSLVLEICEGTVIGYGKSGSLPDDCHNITLTEDFLKAKTGQSFDSEQITSQLQKAGFKVIFKNGEWNIQTPSWRHDITIKENVVEEILRFKGYDQIAESKLPLTHSIKSISPLEKASLSLKNRGLDEVYTFSMLSLQKGELFNNNQNLIQIETPLNQELTTLRPSIIPSLLTIALNNKSKSLFNAAIFEIAPVFMKSSDYHQQNIHISGLRFDNVHVDHWMQKSRSVDAFEAKEDALNVLKAYGISESTIQYDKETPSYYHPNRSLRIKQGQKTIGYFGQIHPLVLKEFDCDQMVVCFEINTENLPKELKSKIPSYTPSPYQPVFRDLAFIADKSLTFDTIAKTIRKTDPQLIQDVVVFDVFENQKIGLNKKSIALRLKIQANNRTLTDTELLELQNNIILACKKIGAEIRDGK
jgi:phenylalanyl-tRNA synthetase beta chain